MRKDSLKTRGRSRSCRFFCFLASLLLLLPCAAPAEGAGDGWNLPEGYQAERVVMLSRHNIRSPLSDGDSMLGKLVPHDWFAWTSPSGELSQRGALLETSTGQFFRKWAEKEGLFPANYQPGKAAVRIYANGYQRTQATARFFASGLLPLADIQVECHAPMNTMDEVFSPRLRFCSDRYREDVLAQIAETGGVAGMEGIFAELQPSVQLLMDVTGMADSKAYQSGEYGDLLDSRLEFSLEDGSSPEVKGYLKTATSVADAMIMQFYEEPDPVKAAFGHELTEDQWRMITGIVTRYEEILFSTPLIALSAAHPMLETIRNELTARDRKLTFLCGHDSNLASVIGALGVEDYDLPEAIETRTPVGAKLVFIRLIDENGDAWYDVSLVYQGIRQMKEIQILGIDTPPMKAALRLKGVPVNEYGLVAEKDLLDLLQNRIDALPLMREQYTRETAAEDAA